MYNAFSDNNQIGVVSSFSELINLHFQGDMNAICWHRNSLGDFKEIVEKIELKENITRIQEEAFVLADEDSLTFKALMASYKYQDSDLISQRAKECCLVSYKLYLFTA